MPVNSDFRDLFAALNAAQAKYLLIGTLADLSQPGIVFHMGIPPNRIDILTGIDAVMFAEAWDDREETRYGDQPVPVLSRAHLIRNKRAAGRPQDLTDVTALEQSRPRGGSRN